MPVIGAGRATWSQRRANRGQDGGGGRCDLTSHPTEVNKIHRIASGGVKYAAGLRFGACATLEVNCIMRVNKIRSRQIETRTCKHLTLL